MWFIMSLTMLYGFLKVQKYSLLLAAGIFAVAYELSKIANNKNIKITENKKEEIKE